MAHETKLMSGRGTRYGHAKDDVVYDECEEIERGENNTIYDRINLMKDKLASTRLGQMVLEKTDRVLKVLEDTAKWSLPQDESDIILERPLPWMLFLPLIVWLRIFRISLSIGLCFVGSQPITPHSIVYYVQTKRRRLRALRLQGLKMIRNRETETTVMYNSSNKSLTFRGKLQRLFHSVICKPEYNYPIPIRSGFIPAATVESIRVKSERPTKRFREDDDEVEVQNLTVSQMLDKYSREDSENDSDYVPTQDDGNESSTSHTISASSDELENAEAEEPWKPQKKTGKSAIDTLPEEQEENEEKIENNSKTIYNSQREDETKIVPHISASNNEQIHKIEDTNGVVEHKDTNETPAAATEVAPQSPLNANKSILNYIAAPRLDENEKKSTPGHESAASLKPSLPTATKPVPLNPPKKEKSYRTITTQTAIELDWTITIKTEITHKKHNPKVENLKYSLNLSPSSSEEDIFYSPTGSLQDFHSIFHPASIVKNVNSKAQTSTPNEADHYQSSGTDNPETLSSGNPKKYFNRSAHSKPYHHNAKIFGKNRR